jgi:hypothetical protein
MNERDLTKERDVRCIPIVHKIFAILAEARLPLGATGETMGAGKTIELYGQAAEQIFPLLRTDAAFTGTEVDYIRRLLLEAIEKTFLIVNETVSFKYDLANARKWGLKNSGDIDKVTLAQIESFLRGEGVMEGESNAIEIPVKHTKKSLVQKVLSWFR